jgi:zinc transporter ZupT
MGTAAAAMLRLILQQLITALGRQQGRPGNRMTSLPTTLTATGLLAWSRLKSRAFTGKQFR